MTKPIIEIDPVLSEATKAREDAVKARARATHATVVVHVATESLAAAHSKAAELLIVAEASEKIAVEHAEKARIALEKQLGLAHEPAAKEAVKDKV